MKRNKTTQFEETKFAKRERRARAYVAKYALDFYQTFGKVYVDGIVYDNFQTAASALSPFWYREVIK